MSSGCCWGRALVFHHESFMFKASATFNSRSFEQSYLYFPGRTRSTQQGWFKTNSLYFGMTKNLDVYNYHNSRKRLNFCHLDCWLYIFDCTSCTFWRHDFFEINDFDYSIWLCKIKLPKRTLFRFFLFHCSQQTAVRTTQLYIFVVIFSF